MTAKTMINTLSVRVKDRHAAVLDRMAVEVNQVWNHEPEDHVPPSLRHITSARHEARFGLMVQGLVTATEIFG